VATQQVIAGHYTSTYNASSLAYTRRGYILHWTSHAEKIDESDAYGRTLLDGIYQGGDIDIEAICRVDSAAAKAAFWPWGASLGAIASTAAPIGRRFTDVAAAFVATVVASTPAATFASPTTITASLAILAPEVDQQIIFSSQAREIPLRFVTLPATGGSSDQNVAKLTLS